MQESPADDLSPASDEGHSETSFAIVFDFPNVRRLLLPWLRIRQLVEEGMLQGPHSLYFAAFPAAD